VAVKPSAAGPEGITVVCSLLRVASKSSQLVISSLSVRVCNHNVRSLVGLAVGSPEDSMLFRLREMVTKSSPVGPSINMQVMRESVCSDCTGTQGF
jgi:hypothetical protein